MAVKPKAKPDAKPDVKKAAPSKVATTKPVTKSAPAKNAPDKNAPDKNAPDKNAPAKNRSDQTAPAKNTVVKTVAAKTPAASSRTKTHSVDDNNLTLPPNYKPSEKDDYMNPHMLAYFKGQLERWKQDLLSDSSDTLESLSDGGMQEPDITDRATAETDRALEFRTRDRERKLIRKIDEALSRIAANDYGYCEETGEPIGIKRLMARPIATLTIEAQERHERQERTQRDEADDQ